MEFCEEFVEEKVKSLVEKVKEVVTTNAPIENMKGATKGNYILEALEVMERCKADCEYADVNLWSFSNSGAGASCSIDRVPNELLRRLALLRKRHKGELTHILNTPALSSSFLECLSDNREWSGLYPSKKYEGVSVEFFESYWKAIHQEKKTAMAQYISGLIMKYKDEKDEAVLSKTDAYEVKNDYTSLLNRILWRATEGEDWSMSSQIAILDDPESLPILYRCFQIYKLVHFYYQKGVSLTDCPPLNVKDTMAFRFCAKMVRLMENSSGYLCEKERISEFRYGEQTNNVDASVFDELLIENAWKDGIYRLYPLFYSTDNKKNIYGVCALLRLYNGNREDLSLEEDNMEFPVQPLDPDIKKWLDRINEFTCQYVAYRFQDAVDKSKYITLCNKIKRSIPRSDLRLQMIWFYSILQRLNESGREWDEYDLIYDPWGNYAFKTFLFAFRLKLNEISSNNINE